MDGVSWGDPSRSKLQFAQATSTRGEGAWWLSCGEAAVNSLEASSVASTSERLSPADFTLSAFGAGLSCKQHNLYKTELCRSWEETGTCRYGAKCQFAHGKNELREVSRHPKYKTEICCTFATTGTCPYGKRCRFIHQNGPITLVGTKQFDDLPLKNCSQSIRNNSGRRQEESLHDLVSFGVQSPSRETVVAAARRLPIFVELSMADMLRAEGQYRNPGKLCTFNLNN